MNTPSPLAARFLNKLHGIKRNGDGWTAQCPAHEDKQNSLSVHEKGGKLLLRCFVTCTVQDIVTALGLEMTDLFQPGNDHTPYTIRNRSGKAVAIHTRVPKGDGKVYTWERDGKPNLGGLATEHVPLWNVDQLGDSPYVIVTEGEGAAQSLLNRGYPAVGTATGASGTPSYEVLRSLITPLPEGGHLVRAALAIRARFRVEADAEAFNPHQKRAVYLWPDNDDAGRDHMNRIAERLVRLGEWPLIITVEGAPPKGDAANYEGDVDELLGNALPWEGRDLHEPLKGSWGGVPV